MDRLAYSINETAHILSCGCTTIYLMISDGRF